MPLRKIRQPNQNGQSKEDWPFALLSILYDHLAIRFSFVLFDDHPLTWLFPLFDNGHGATVSIIVPVSFTNGNTWASRSDTNAHAHLLSISGYRNRNGRRRRQCDCVLSNHVSLHKMTALPE